MTQEQIANAILGALAFLNESREDEQGTVDSAYLEQDFENRMEALAHKILGLPFKAQPPYALPMEGE